jgi:hypothetical protein
MHAAILTNECWVLVHEQRRDDAFDYRSVYLNNNGLTGDVPPGLPRPEYSSNLDYNCFNGCSYYRASQCSPPTNASQLSALVDFYHATGACCTKLCAGCGGRDVCTPALSVPSWCSPTDIPGWCIAVQAAHRGVCRPAGARLGWWVIHAPILGVA